MYVLWVQVFVGYCNTSSTLQLRHKHNVHSLVVLFNHITSQTPRTFRARTLQPHHITNTGTFLASTLQPRTITNTMYLFTGSTATTHHDMYMSSEHKSHPTHTFSVGCSLSVEAKKIRQTGILDTITMTSRLLLVGRAGPSSINNQALVSPIDQNTTTANVITIRNSKNTIYTPFLLYSSFISILSLKQTFGFK